MHGAARFRSQCSRCARPIEVGARIIYGDGFAARHEACDAIPITPPPVLQLAGIVAFIKKAQDGGLKRPAVRFLGPDGQSEMRLSLADLPQFLGNVRVKFGGRWVGRIDPEGQVHGPLARMRDVLDEIAAAEQDPAKAARRYGALMQHCSFCGLPLTDAGSVELGYGPICAINWNLPHIPYGVTEVQVVPKVDPVAAATSGDYVLCEHCEGTGEIEIETNGPAGTITNTCLHCMQGLVKKVGA